MSDLWAASDTCIPTGVVAVEAGNVLGKLPEAGERQGMLRLEGGLG